VQYTVADGIVTLTWDTHDLTDVTGSVTETGIPGYSVYKVVNGTDVFLGTAVGTAFTNSPAVHGAVYKVIAADANGNVSASSEVTVLLSVIKRSDINASSGSSLNTSVIQTMLEDAVKELTVQTDVGKAYESLFPGIDATKTIAVKVNTLAGSKLSTHPQVVEALIRGLSLMLGGTFPLYNIIVFDDRFEGKMTAAGFTLQDGPNTYRCVSTKDNWSAAVHSIGGTSQRLSKIADEADYIINVPVLKDHSEAGITFSLKNFYGIISAPGDMHGNQCDPMIAEVYSLVRNKVKLIVGDAIFGAHRGGPDANPTFIANTLLVGKDPVAMDLQALAMINTERQKNNMSVISAGADGEARHIYTAGQPPYSLDKV
jgi:uncharacterized protein (DUF362 family)